MDYGDWRNGEPAGLIVLTDGAGGLWDRESRELVAAVEERMACFVTFATCGSAAPSVDDAIAACRYMGCDGAIVVDVTRRDGNPQGVRSETLIAVERAEPSALAIKSAYHRGSVDARTIAV